MDFGFPFGGGGWADFGEVAEGFLEAVARGDKGPSLPCPVPADETGGPGGDPEAASNTLVSRNRITWLAGEIQIRAFRPHLPRSSPELLWPGYHGGAENNFPISLLNDDQGIFPCPEPKFTTHGGWQRGGPPFTDWNYCCHTAMSHCRIAALPLCRSGVLSGAADAYAVMHVPPAHHPDIGGCGRSGHVLPERSR